MKILSEKKGSAILIALVVLTLLVMMSTVFFEKLFRFSQASEGIENSNVAYYTALGTIEEALYTGWVNKYTPWNIQNLLRGSSSSTGIKLTVYTGSNIVPAPWKWNSEYDSAKDYNIISIWEPIQLVIPDGITPWSDVKFEFRVPVVGSGGTGVLASAMGSWYIIWTLASSGASLFASGETNTFQGNKINILNNTIATFKGTSNSWSEVQFDSFYTDANYLWASWTKCANFACTLKLSLIRPVPLDGGRTINFLEYRISGLTKPIPSQYMTIHSEWYAYGFLRSRDIQFPQITTNTALDFAVLQ